MFDVFGISLISMLLKRSNIKHLVKFLVLLVIALQDGYLAIHCDKAKAKTCTTRV